MTNAACLASEFSSMSGNPGPFEHCHQLFAHGCSMSCCWKYKLLRPMTASRTCVPHLQVQFVLDDNFKLDDLLKLELHKFADEVGEIVDCAQKEEKMEQGLAKLKVVCWPFL